MAEQPVVSIWAVREQLERVENSPAFAESDRLRELLRHLVEQTLAGDIASLKEAAIGNAVYTREPAYDPRFDSTVRVEARRLRRKLKSYYDGAETSDRVLIELPTGSYVPLFSWLERDEASATAASTSDEGRIFQRGSGAVLAILPFTALSAGPDEPTFATELTDELIFAMERAPGWRVASRSMTFRYRDRPYSIPEVARELGADGVLQGTVRRIGEMIRVTVEMADPTGFVAWSDRFDERFENRLHLQEQIATTIMSRSNFDSSRMRARQIRGGPGSLEANAAIYRARRLLDLQSPEALRQALSLFSQVAASAADYARGFTGISDCHCDLFRLGLVDRPAALAATRSAVSRALEIDPDSVEAHCARANVAAWLEWDRAVAETSFEAALALGGNARSARLFGVLLTYEGRTAEADRMFRRAREVEPISNQQDCAEAVRDYQTRRFDRLAAEAEGHGETPPEVAFHRALGLAFSGRADQARRYAGTLDAAGEDYPLLAGAGAEIRAWAGDPAGARALLGGPARSGTHFALATLAMACGDYPRALAELDGAIIGREIAAVWIGTDARFDALRDTPEFAGLLERIRTAAAIL